MHLAALAIALPLYDAAKPKPIAVTAVDVAVAPSLETTPPPPPPEYVPPARVEEEVTPRDVLPETSRPSNWEIELDPDTSERVREIIAGADPRDATGRFRPARHTGGQETPGEPDVPRTQTGPRAGSETGTANRAAPPPSRPSRPAMIVAHIAPRYPRSARRRGIEGAVELRVVVEADGTIGTIEVAKTSGFAILDRAAIAAVEDWTFRAAEVRGQTVRSTLDLPPIRFRLTD